MRALAASLALALTLPFAASARAGTDSFLRLGVGGGVGERSAVDLDGVGATAFVNQANVRVGLAHVFGLDLSCDLTHDAALTTPALGLQQAAKLRVTALLYPYSGEHLGFYLGGGVGATSLGELARLDGPGLSLHAGAGLEVRLGSHLALDLSFMLVAPGPRSIERATVASLEAAYAAGGADAVRRVDAPGLDDVVSLRSHELMIRFFLFL